MQLHIKVKPNSKTDEIIREPDGSLKIKIKAPPLEGKANKYLVEYFAEILNLPKSKVTLFKGNSSSFKTLQLDASEQYVLGILSKF